ncbi:MAG: DUF455 family protein, partial [Nannocystaceae bacterium]
ERVLFGTHMEDKLCPPRHLSDLSPGPPVDAPAFPTRPPCLGFEPAYRRRRVAFPSLRDLETERGRGVALHFFANHELLALETMALALLRFPTAQASFRRELVVTMAEEQGHLRRYCERMSACNVSLGELPVSAFFWNCIRDAPTPIEFVVRLSLTFEQANLDHARHYANAFRTVGDVSTARIIDSVYRDEIVHVKRGLAWFNRWRDPKEDEYQAYARRLSLPLSPARARGATFCAEARRQAGLSENFIRQIETASASKGRPPSLHFFTPLSELELAWGPGHTPPRRLDLLRQDLETLPMFLAARDDVVMVEHPPDPAWIDELRRAGAVIPEFLRDKVSPTQLPYPHISDLCPWGWSPRLRRRLAPYFSRLSGSAPRLYTAPWRDQTSELYAKALSAKLLNDFLAHNNEAYLCDRQHVGTVATTYDAALQRAAELHECGFSSVVIKGVFGTSGHNMWRMNGQPIGDRGRGWLENTLTSQGRVVVEPWLDKVCDLSLRMRIVEPGRASVQGVGRFLTSPRGQYRGAVIGPLSSGFDRAALRFASDEGRTPRRIPELFHAVAQHIAHGLREWNYTGLIGVDALLFRHEGTLRIKPIVEINARPNMGHVAEGLRRLVHHRHVGLWLIASTRELTAAGFESAAHWAQTLGEAAPPQWIGNGGERRLSAGALLTTDPARAQAFVSVLAVGADLPACERVLAPLRVPDLHVRGPT